MSGKIIRVTMFKIPKHESQLQMAENYKVLFSNATKDGKAYILSLEAGPVFADPRSQGFTFAAKNEFASTEDMKYYDEECEAHKALKVNGKDLGIEGMMMVYYDPIVVS